MTELNDCPYATGTYESPMLAALGGPAETTEIEMEKAAESTNTISFEDLDPDGFAMIYTGLTLSPYGAFYFCSFRFSTYLAILCSSRGILIFCGHMLTHFLHPMQWSACRIFGTALS